MIRLIQRRLIVPRGDTGTFSIPVLAGKDTGDASVFTIFNPLTHRKIFEKVMQLSDGVLTMDLSHGDTVNLPVGQFVWDIKFYTNPTIADGHIVDGEEVDSYYAAFTLPVCEIRETGDNLLFSDEAPQATLSPGQIDYITASINEVTDLKNATASSAAEADTSAQNAETSASAAAVSEQAAQDSQEAALASQQAAQTAAEQAIASAEAAAETAAQIEADLESKANIADLDDVAFSGNYNDLSNTPYIPNKTSDLTNDSNYAVDANYVHTDNNYTTAEKNKLSGIAAGAEVNVNADWNAVDGDAFILNKPTKVSDFDNDAGYLTEHQDISGKANSADLATVATSGSYNDLENKPFIPSAVSDLTDDSGHYTKPANGIPATDMTSGVQTSLGLADTAYQKPNNGIPASDLASGVIPSVPVQDVQIKNTSILNNGVANIPLAANGAVGLVQGNNTYGTAITAAGDIMIYRADDSAIKNGNGEYKPIVPYTEHQAVFYGLAKAAGDTTQRASQNNVGIYTSSAKSAIQAMLDVPSTSSVASSIASAIGNVNSFDMVVVQALPTQDINTHTIYLVPKTGETNDVYDEYVYINNAWEMIGNTQIDLSGKADKTDTVLETTLSRGRKEGSVVGFASLVFGEDAVASDEYSVSLGYGNDVTGWAAYAEGDENVASGDMSHAEGDSNVAAGIGAHVEGIANEANGDQSHAEGYGNIANGNNQHVMGIHNIESTLYSNWIANTSYEVGDKILRYNYSYECITANEDSSWNSSHWKRIEFNTDEIFIIGNGSGFNSRSNAVMIDWHGNEKIAGDLYIHANNDSTGGTKVLCEADFATDSDIQNIINGGAGA